jgi:hypothetical protein
LSLGLLSGPREEPKPRYLFIGKRDQGILKCHVLNSPFLLYVVLLFCTSTSASHLSFIVVLKKSKPKESFGAYMARMGISLPVGPEDTKTPPKGTLRYWCTTLIVT